MSKPSVIVALCLALAAPLGAQRSGFPPGPMQETAQLYCLACHDAQITIQQRLDRAGWTRVIDKMIRWGTPVEPADRQPLIDYFAQHFAPQPPRGAASLAEGEGAEAVRETCLACHNAGRITAQQLDRRAWSRKVDKMARWGADVAADRRDAILDYLARHYGPSPQP